MDIFEIAQQGMEIQEKEKLQVEEEAQDAEVKKKAKLDIWGAIQAVSDKDYDWFNRLGEDQRLFQPFILNMWLGQMNSPNKSRGFNSTDAVYAETIKNVNQLLNKEVFNASKEMFWLLACSTIEYNLGKINVEFVKGIKDTSAKYDKRVIDYMAKELWTSKAKIMDMIDAGLITDEEMKVIGKDLDTLEDPKKKKK